MISNRMPADPRSAPPADDRLDSWKEIAVYLRKGIRTVQRWEQTEGLPVRRHGQDRPSSVFAYKSELDAWLDEQSRRPEEQRTPDVATVPATGSRARWYFAAVAGVVAIAAAVIAWKAWPSGPVLYRPVPLTSDHGWEQQPAFSPDGRQIAYVWVQPNQAPFIYVKTFADSETRLTKGERPESRPAWSPDGRFIAFLRFPGRNENPQVMLIPAAGGTETRISELSAGGLLSWSADGQWLIAFDGPARERSIVAISVATGAKHRLTGPEEFGYSGAGLSPDSRRLIFSPGRLGKGTIFELALGPGLTPVAEPRRVVSDFWAREIVVTPDGKEVILNDGSHEEGIALYRLALFEGATPRLIHTSQATYYNPAISRDGRKLAFSVTRIYREDIWKLALDRPDAKAVPLVSTTHSDLNPGYSPDGRYIAFHSTRSGTSDIWIAANDGSNSRRLTFTNARTTATSRWSPNGEWIAFESNLTGQTEVYVVRSSGGPIRRLTDNPAIDAIPSWSRDGQTLYFCSDRTGRYEVWKMPAAGGPATQITRGGGFAAVESPDGRYLYYSETRNNGPVWRMPLAGGQSEEIIPQLHGLFYAASAKGIYFNVHNTLSFWDAATGEIRELFKPAKPVGIGMALSPDGQSLLFTQIERDASDIYMIDGLR